MGEPGALPGPLERAALSLTNAGASWSVAHKINCPPQKADDVASQASNPRAPCASLSQKRHAQSTAMALSVECFLT